MRNLIDFVNHGVLPFAGRQEVTERLLGFWQETRDSHEARALLLVGEAGMGKSRVIEELMPHVRRSDGVTVHVKLYPDSTTVLAPLVAQALWQSEVGRKLLKEEPERTIPSVVAALRHLARLRPVLLVIEDVHLLDHEAVGDFMALFNGIADEPLSLIAAARPGELPARGILAPYLVAEVRLEGLTHDDVAELWYRFFETSPDTAFVDLLLQHTHGNPMALRTALRNALRSGTLARNEASGKWELTVPVEAFSEKLAEDLRLFSGGMTAHLTPAEKSAAAQLATLGETFSRKSGTGLLGDESRRIEALIFKGVVTNLGLTIQPLCGNYETLPLLGFTHSLIHDHLLGENAIDPNRLLKVIAGGDPLCSTVPYRLLTEHAHEISESVEMIRSAIDRIVENVLPLDATADWRNGLIMLDTADALLERIGELSSRIETLELRLKLMASRLRLSQRENHTEEYMALVERFHAATEDVSEELAEYRLASLTYWFGQLRRMEADADFSSAWEEVESFVREHPGLRSSIRYVEFLQVVGRTTNTLEDVDIISLVDERLSSLMNDPDVPEKIKSRAMREVAPLLLWKFSSPEELADRLDLLERLREVAGDSLWFRTRAMAFFEGIGRHRETLELGDDLIPVLRSRDMRRDLAQVRILRLTAFAILGAPIDRIDSELADVVAEAPNEIQLPLRRLIARRFTGVALARGETAWARRIVETYANEKAIGPIEHLLLYLNEGKGLESLPETGRDHRVLEVTGASIVRRLLGEEIDDEDIRAEIAERLAIPFYIRAQALDRHLVISLLELLSDTELEHSLRDTMRASLIDAFEWLREHELPAIGIPLLERSTRYLSAKERTSWQKCFADQMGRRPGSLFADEEELCMEISVIGDIGIKRRGEPRLRVRGGRLRSVIGLLVANEILPAPLSYREFCRLASGGEEDPERARKTSSMGLLRLREAYGDEIVKSGEGESPSLNLGCVRVDLLDAIRLTREAVREVHNGSLMRAHPPLCTALEILNGEVPFPALYDDFFEAIRGDIDYLVREGILEVGSGLIREHDYIVAEQVLRLAVRVMPHDEEIVELLSQVLVGLGKRTEAERLRMRQEELEQGW